MSKSDKKEYLELVRGIEVKEAYCRNCSKCDCCYQEGQFGEFNLNNNECRSGLQYADKKQLKKDLVAAHNYMPGNFQM